MADEKRKIFLIDDEEDLVFLTSKRIQTFGYEVVSFLEGKGALDAIRKAKPALILLDIWLPDITGIDIFKQLREDPELKTIPVIFFSANPSKEEYCLNELGAEGFLRKPYNPNQLLELIQKVVK